MNSNNSNNMNPQPMGGYPPWGPMGFCPPPFYPPFMPPFMVPPMSPFGGNEGDVNGAAG